MPYEIHNPTRGTRVIYAADGRQIEIKPDETVQGVNLAPHVAVALSEVEGDLELSLEGLNGFPAVAGVNPVIEDALEQQAAETQTKPSLVLQGMFGIGDNLHQRALLRVLMQKYDVWLGTCHVSLYHDLIEQGLKVFLRPTRLRAQAKTIEREIEGFRKDKPPRIAAHRKLWYMKPDIDRFGSIMQAMFGNLGLEVPEHPDFSLPIKNEWREAAQKYIAEWKSEKPLMIYRPIVIRREWDSSSRNPDPAAYDELHRAIRKQFFVVSVADLEPQKEWILGPEPDCDVKLHSGELDFPTMAGLFAEANLVFSPAGFAPVLAQAVGTPVIIIYGGRESYKTTERAGEHLAPSLGINPINPCDCHSHTHQCDKRINIPQARAHIQEFVAENIHNKRTTLATLIFATTYVDTEDKAKVLRWWEEIADDNFMCDRLIVDSCSPLELPLNTRYTPHGLQSRARRMLHVFPDNIGHLGKGGKDGWGRAFCYGLQAAIDGGYQYVIHIEGDLLFRPSVDLIVDQMNRDGLKAASVPVRGTKHPESGWAETAVIAFSVKYLMESKFIERYNWQDANKHYPKTPEHVVRELLGRDLTMMRWRGQRDDKHEITVQNLIEKAPDFITHAEIAVMERFMRPITTTRRAVVKINLGCGANKLAGWENRDAEVDISKPLPFADNHADYILAEHVVEHIEQYPAIRFFRECYRVLRPEGVLRIAVPSIEQIRQCQNADYYKFTEKFQKEGATARGAMWAILNAHGHKAAWTASLLDNLLFYVGFDLIEQRAPGHSEHEALRDVEGHGKVIGNEFNRVETLVMEATKPKPEQLPMAVAPVPVIPNDNPVAIIVGGAECWREDLDAAIDLCRARGLHPVYFYMNDQIAYFHKPGFAITLHPDKLERWLTERRSKGFPPPEEVWAHRQGKFIDHSTRDWAGSSGLFAVKIAREKGYERVICCGVPMTPEAGHFLRKSRWHSFNAFRQAWELHRAELSPYVRSCSGWTAQILGKPDPSFLQ